MKCIGGQIKGFSFLFSITCDAKSTKRWRVLTYRVITKQPVMHKLIKRTQTCSVSFVKLFRFQDNKFKVVEKNF